MSRPANQATETPPLPHPTLSRQPIKSRKCSPRNQRPIDIYFEPNPENITLIVLNKITISNQYERFFM